MPELPEVETIVRQLRKQLVGQQIKKVKILRPSQWKQNNPKSVEKVLKHKTIQSINRRAKFIYIDFEDDCQLVIHLRMSGKLIWSDSDPKIDKYSRTIFYFTSGSSLQFNDTRALGTLVFLLPEKKDNWQTKLGLEPLGEDLDFEKLQELIQKSKLDMKSFLLDQSKVAGIGNIYAGEILFLAGIHPERKALTLTEKEIEKLRNTITLVLQLAVDKMGTSLGDGASNFRSLYNIEGEFQKMIMVYDREGEQCFKCKAPIFRIKQKGRSSYFCGECQQ
ncbi:bifunctional DNA-formamidopyrimidine glycosylase/DNA-(apurinic or apyrimidinic site) lyase [candidate division KSB1 bacterium]|nr:bifunctional DNA-formamidopyrimidine glycosylase/DNA-(apurinic or apyrimidinic site) lyase [candidate division KSB1 bacterium]MBL7093332.1 bifunctional DNA-formamidopyrimidine glycosylase/DNA-(apurinic or apyrimidinic site) lyase [candidate division KSB1 bacterium]